MSHANTNISAALSSRLNSMANLPPVVWENSDTYSPVSGTPYLAEHYLPAPTVPVGVADNSSNDFRGVYQIDIRAPLNKSKFKANQIADQVLAHFRRGTEMTFGGIKVRVETADRAQGRPDGGWWFVPVSINWRAFDGNV